MERLPPTASRSLNRPVSCSVRCISGSVVPPVQRSPGSSEAGRGSRNGDMSDISTWEAAAVDDVLASSAAAITNGAHG